MQIARAILILAAAGLPAAPALAQSATPSPGQDNSTIVVKGQKEKKVCKIFDAPTGSRIGERRVCRSQSEWQVAERTAQQTIDRENQRLNADRSQSFNETNGMARKLPR